MPIVRIVRIFSAVLVVVVVVAAAAVVVMIALLPSLTKNTV